MQLRVNITTSLTWLRRRQTKWEGTLLSQCMQSLRWLPAKRRQLNHSIRYLVKLTSLLRMTLSTWLNKFRTILQSPRATHAAAKATTSCGLVRRLTSSLLVRICWSRSSIAHTLTCLIIMSDMRSRCLSCLYTTLSLARLTWTLVSRWESTKSIHNRKRSSTSTGAAGSARIKILPN